LLVSKTRFKVLSVLAVMILGAATVVFTELTRVSTVVVRGAGAADEAVQRGLETGLYGNSLFSVSKASLADMLASTNTLGANLKIAAMSDKFPNTIVVKLEKRKPVVTVQGGYGLTLSGTVVDDPVPRALQVVLCSAIRPSDIAAVSGISSTCQPLSLKPGEHLGTWLVKLALAVKHGWIEPVTSVGIMVGLNAGPECLLDDGENLSALRTCDLLASSGETVDIRAIDDPARFSG
jgi:hypothetical protein